MINTRDYIKQEIRSGNVEFEYACKNSEIKELENLKKLDSNYNIEEKIRKRQKLIMKLKEYVVLTDDLGRKKNLDKGDMLIVAPDGSMSSIKKENYKEFYTESDISLIDKFKKVKNILSLKESAFDILKNNNSIEVKELSADDATILKCEIAKSNDKINCSIGFNKDNPNKAIVCVEKKDLERVESLIQKINSLSIEDKEKILHIENNKPDLAKVALVKKIYEKYEDEKVFEQIKNLDKDLHILTADELRALHAAGLGYDTEIIISQIYSEMREANEMYRSGDETPETTDPFFEWEDQAINENPETVNGEDKVVEGIEKHVSLMDSVNAALDDMGAFDYEDRSRDNDYFYYNDNDD